MNTAPSLRQAWRRSADAGFTLVELLIALVLSGVIAGVTVAAMLTSMAVIDSTTAQVADSTDAGLISAYFYRDAQAVGITDPATALPGVRLGIAVGSAPGTDPWAGCNQPGAFVVRFAWLDGSVATGTGPVVTTYALSSSGTLVRRSCDGGTIVDVELAQSLTTATATCLPDPTCQVPTERVSLALAGSADRGATAMTLVASVRSRTQTVPTVSTAMQVPLVVTGTTGLACPDLSLAGTGAVGVLGTVVVSDRCGTSPIGGIMTKLDTNGTTEMRSGVADPLAAVAEPSVSCAATGPDPSPVGVSPSAISTVVYRQPVRIVGPVTFAAGRYVFCAGISVAAGSVVTGTDVYLDVVGGATTVEPNATVDLSAATDGPYANVLLWVSSTEPVTISTAGRASTYRGIVHAVRSSVSVTAASPLMIGGLIAPRVSFAGASPVRLGLPNPVISIAATVWPTGEVGAAFPLTVLDAGGGTAPYTWSAVGLPAGLTLDATGSVTGVPTIAGTFTATVTAVDRSLAGGTSDITVTIAPQLTIGAGAARPAGQVGVPYSSTGPAVAGGLAPFTWSASGLPPGTMMTAIGTIEGTPTVAGSFDVVTTVVDALGGRATRSDAITVRRSLAVSGPATMPDALAGVAYVGVSAAATGGLAPYTWTAAGLPAGLAMSTSGAVTGMPTVVGSFGVIMTVTDASGATATATASLTVVPSANSLRPVAPAAGFQLFVLGGASSFGDTVAGGVAVGGNLSIDGVGTFATGEASAFVPIGNSLPDGLAVGGAVALAASGSTAVLTVNTGVFQAGDANGNTIITEGATTLLLAGIGVSDPLSTPRVGVVQQGTQPVLGAPPPPFASAFTTLRSNAIAMALLTPAACPSMAGASLTTAGGANTLTLVPDKINIWSVNAAQLAAIGPIDGPVRPSASTHLIIVITDTGAVVLPTRNDPLLRNGLASAVLWDFPSATAVSVNDALRGTLFAPAADVTLTNVAFDGDVIASTLRMSGSTGSLAHFSTAIDCGTSLTVPSAPPLAGGQVEVTYSPAALSASGGIAPYRWTVTGMPGGLSASTDGLITGTPTEAGTFSVVAVATDAAGVTASNTFVVSIAARPTIASPTSLANGKVGVGYSVGYTVSGGTAPFTFSVSGLPAGLSISTAGLISGTPTAAGAFSVVATATDARGATANLTLPLTVAAASGCSVSSGTWVGEYFTNMKLTGPATVCRNDTAINFNWGTGSPDPKIPVDSFSARWTRTIDFAAGTYDFTKSSDDGWRLYIDAVLVLDDWNYQSYAGSTKIAPVALTAGPHTIVAEYFEGNGNAAVALSWAPTVAATCPNAKGWLGEYFGGIGFTGTKVLCRDDTQIDFNWGLAAPNPKLPVDRFSVRWTMSQPFNAGNYSFELGSDDGARLYIDGVLVIDVWQNRTYAVTKATISLAKGNHRIVLEYYDDSGPARVALSW